MHNVDVATVLDELADLLEIRGDNPFRIRAYRNAVRTVEGLTRSLAEMVEAGDDLTELPGIGKEIARHIRELLETGQLGRFEELAEEIPPTVVELMRLPGLGPKKAKKLWSELGVESVATLEPAIVSGAVQGLAGFGKKSAEKLLVAIEDHRSRQGRFRRSEAEVLLEGLLEHVRAAPGVEGVEVAGSLRRRRDTVRDVDLLARCEGDGEAVVRHFAAFPGAARVEAAGGTKGSLVLRSGLAVDLRVIPARSWGAALHYFTGSKEHNVRVRTLGVKRGLRINEWGVFRVPEGADPETLGKEDGERVGGTEEADVFEALGLPWIPPELREDRGEVAAAAEGRLPELVSLGDIRGDLHMHTTWSDGRRSVEEMARACAERGYEYLAVTDHSRAVTVAQGLGPERLREQWEEIEAVRERVPEIRIFRGMEVDVLRDGSLDMPDDVLAGLDLVIVSVHSFMEMGREEMTERVLRAVRHPSVDILGHPTGRLLGRRKPYDLDVEAVLQAAAEADVAVEINASPNRLDLNDLHAMRARELGVKVAVDTDAHSIRGLDVMRYGVDQGRRGWLERRDVVNAMSVEDFERWLRRRG